MSLGDRINEIRKQKQISIDELCERSGVPKGTLSKITAGITTSPTLDTVRAIARALSCRLDDLDDNPEVEQTLSEREQTVIKKYRTLDEYGKDTIDILLSREYDRCTEMQSEALAEIIELPFPIQSASAGTGELADDETVEHIPVLRNVWTSKADYALRVHGDSMEPEIYDGDMLLVRSQPAVELGETGIFIRDGERFVKIYRGDYLESLNPTYENVPLEEYSKCIGKVIGVLKPEWVIK